MYGGLMFLFLGGLIVAWSVIDLAPDEWDKFVEMFIDDDKEDGK